MLQGHSQRESGREVGAVHRRQQQGAVKDLVASVGALDGKVRRTYICPQEHQGSCGKLRHFDGIQRNIKRVSHIRFPIWRCLRLKGVPNNGIPILEVAIRGENGNAFARPIVGKRIVHFAHGVRLAGNRRAGQLDDCRIERVVHHGRLDLVFPVVLPVSMAIVGAER